MPTTARVPRKNSKLTGIATNIVGQTMTTCRIAAVLLCSAGALHGATCAGLTRLTIPNTTVASATDTPAYCRVAAVAHPVAGSEIHIEIWLPPPEAWNGKF